jgi:iron complex outermembrane receptor protein
MKTKFIILFVATLSFVINIKGQNIITGNITDSETGESLPGVNVIVPELSKGTYSGNDGTYRIENLPVGNFIIRFSYVGYQTVVKKVKLTGNPVTVDVKMKTLVVQGEEVVVSGSFTETQHENTIKIESLDKKSITTDASPSFLNVISSVPGVSMISKGPGVATPVIRGLSTSNVLMLNNGVSMENFQFSKDHPYMVDRWGVGHIEVIRGPASLIYGSGAVGGVINILPEPVAIENSIQGDVSLKMFSNTSGIASSLNIKGNTKGFVWGIRGTVNSNCDYYQGNGKYAPNTRFNNASIKANAGLIKRKGVYRIFYEHHNTKLGMAVPPALSIVNERGRKNRVWYQDLTYDFITSKNKVFLGKTNIDATISYQQNNRKLQGSDFTPVKTLVDMNLKTLSYKLKSKFDAGDKSTAIAGIQGMWQNNKNGNAPNHIIPDATISDFSVFGLYKYTFDKLFLIETGLRYDHRHVSVPEQNSIDELNLNFDNISGSVGATLNLNEAMLLRFNVASAYRNPNLAELTQNGLHGVRYEIGSKDLKNQQNLETDIGYHVHTRHTSFDITLFYNKINNFIYLSPTADTTPQGYKIYRYKQTASRLYGGETSIHIHPHPWDRLHIKISYAYLIGEKSSGGYLPLIPANKLHAELMLKNNSWKNFRESYIKLSSDYVFAQNRPSEFEDNSPAYALCDFYMGTDIKTKNNRSINITFAVTNIFNKEYIDHLSSLHDVNLYNMGRNVSFSVHIPFGKN